MILMAKNVEYVARLGLQEAYFRHYSNKQNYLVTPFSRKFKYEISKLMAKLEEKDLN